MMVSINQPAYLPWLGYFDRIAKSDKHLVLDHVQFEKNSMVNRNKIKTANGWCWLTIPLKTAGQFGDLAINKVQINNSQNWQKKHWNSIYFNYKKSPFFERYAEQLESFYQQKWDSLGAALKWQLSFFLEALGISTPVVYSSDADYQLTKSELVLEICQAHQASTYLSGPFGRDYLDHQAFVQQEIEVRFQDYNHPAYQQLHGDFISHLSVLDLLCNHGVRSKEILISNK